MDEILEFNLKHMKVMPNDWHLPLAVSGFAACQLKSKISILTNLYKLVLWQHVVVVMDQGRVTNS